MTGKGIGRLFLSQALQCFLSILLYQIFPRLSSI
nr:MAG TPA: hypothetical protein [Caudoviricetes sp.]